MPRLENTRLTSTTRKPEHLTSLSFMARISRRWNSIHTMKTCLSFPVKVEVRNDARKAHWLAQTVMKVAGDVLSVAPLSETHYLDIPSGEAQAWLLKDLQDDVELPLHRRGWRKSYPRRANAIPCLTRSLRRCTLPLGKNGRLPCLRTQRSSGEKAVAPIHIFSCRTVTRFSCG